MQPLLPTEYDGKEPTPFVALTQPISHSKYDGFSVSAHTAIGMIPRGVPVTRHTGDRKAQEDRFIVVPNLGTNGNQVAFFGVFDGTVGHFASDTIQKIIVRHLVSTDVWAALMRQLDVGEDDKTTIPALAVLAVSKMYSNADAELLELCRKQDNHYSSCTSVTVLLVNDYTIVAHVGDSRVSLCYEEGGQVLARFVTTDHKPNMPVERRRIQDSGGSVQYLSSHHNKPFLRGGDFLARKAKGDQPMQIQYSRAFGGKDLKTFGLSCEPDIAVFRREGQHKGLILASDGLWDANECQKVFSTVFYALRKGENPSRLLIDNTLKQLRCTSRRSDNITAIVVVFE
ncbi:serine threonine phosphatase 2C containing protein, putative [Babesia bigemina]|uniref:Serine threonine phosphatase 2C containing protein, putative n=1 Tax=Babesia bigemina TaxID=5866 RepID=A0A061D315_BABBI|nr:serine threonine phosphatase 2C containing protein, putative [Babesia bigemina]CDR95008.1 serine threonine phosphatase 2C containing protein, putative [Babesia bigemina]|eukprot:XP_012767194.1 serine threonine phosphatase 2C containing protein, putative [Babesia bigemina]